MRQEERMQMMSDMKTEIITREKDFSEKSSHNHRSRNFLQQATARPSASESASEMSSEIYMTTTQHNKTRSGGRVDQRCMFPSPLPRSLAVVDEGSFSCYRACYERLGEYRRWGGGSGRDPKGRESQVNFPAARVWWSR